MISGQHTAADTAERPWMEEFRVPFRNFRGQPMDTPWSMNGGERPRKPPFGAARAGCEIPGLVVPFFHLRAQPIALQGNGRVGVTRNPDEHAGPGGDFAAAHQGWCNGVE